MFFFSKKPTVVVHDGQFHADDIFAVASVSLALGKKIQIIRTRDEEKIATADYVLDVGGVHDPRLNRFDHHQKGGAGARENGIPYAAFGLVWKEFGEKICGSKEIAERIDTRLVSPIDAEDNGVNVVSPLLGISQYTLQGYLYLQRPSWKESTEKYATSFLMLVEEAKKILLREIELTAHYLEARDAVRSAYERAPDKRIIELDHAYPYQETLMDFPEPLFVILQKPSDGSWKLECVRKETGSFANRKDLPASWAGLRDTELQKETGVQSAVFCHNGRWLCVAKNREDILKLSQIALNF